MTAGWFLATLRHDRAVVLGSLAFVVLLAWTYLLLGAGVGMEMMDIFTEQKMGNAKVQPKLYGVCNYRSVTQHNLLLVTASKPPDRAAWSRLHLSVTS
jgi:predicted metal-binding membrane protein